MPLPPGYRIDAVEGGRFVILGPDGGLVMGNRDFVRKEEAMQALDELLHRGDPEDTVHKLGGIVPSRPPVELSFIVSPEFAEVLDRMAKETGKDRAEILRLALGLLRIGLDAKAEGNLLAVVTPEYEVDQEIGGF